MVTEKTAKSAESKLKRKLRNNCFLYGGINRFKILKKSFIEYGVQYKIGMYVAVVW